MRRMVILLLGMFGLYTASFAQETGRWPISNSSANTADVLTSAYGPRYLSSSKPYDIHEGIDIRTWVNGQPAPVPVYPWKSGMVEDIGGAENGPGGWWVKIRHDKAGNSDPWRTGYYHLTKDSFYDALDEDETLVYQGTRFVTSGSSGAQYAHLHFNYLLGCVSNPPNDPGQDVLNNARNPMHILPYENDQAPETATGTLYISNGYVTACSFSVTTDGEELDLDRVEVKLLFNTSSNPSSDKLVVNISQRSNVYDILEPIDGEFYATTDNGLQMRVLIDPEEFLNSIDGDQQMSFAFNVEDAWMNVPEDAIVATVYDIGRRYETVRWEVGVNREIVNFTATGGYQQVTLNWEAYEFDPNIWFNIYRSIDGGVSYPQQIGSVQYTGDGSYSFVDNTVEYDYEYRYMIQDTEGPGWWGPASASPTGGVSAPPVPSPSPTISVDNTGFETVGISINSGSDYASSYEIGYDPDGAEPYEYSDYFTGSTRDLRNLSNGLRYYIAVRGINASGSSGHSNQVNAIPDGRHPAQNLSLEQISGENIDYWYPFGSGTFGSSTVAMDGSRSAHFVRTVSDTGSYSGFYQRYIQVEPDSTYYMGVWVKTANMTSGYVMPTLGVWENRHIVSIGYITEDTDWTYLSGSWTAAGDEDRIQIQLPCATNFVGEAWFDGLYFDTQPPPNPPVVDALPSPTNQSTITVTGTQDANTSILKPNGEVLVAVNSSTTWWASWPLVEGSNTIQVRSADQARHVSGLSNAQVVVRDTQAPVISSVGASNIAATSATIAWSTNENSDSKVDYGPTTSYGSTTSDTTLVTSHSIDLTGLSGHTTYHYRVRSEDAAGNEAACGDYTSTTTHSGVEDNC